MSCKSNKMSRLLCHFDGVELVAHAITNIRVLGNRLALLEEM